MEQKKEPWILKFDGSSIENSAGVGIEIISPRRVKTTLSFNLALNTLTITTRKVTYRGILLVGVNKIRN